MKLPWIIQVGPKCNHKCLDEGETEGESTENRNVQEEKAMKPQRQNGSVKNAGSHKQLEDTRSRF